MMRFSQNELKAAVQFAASGGQALHCHRILRRGAPSCFISAIKSGQEIAHLFDQDVDRLVATARELGVRVVVVEKRGTSKQHVDLCGKPLQKALQRIADEENADCWLCDCGNYIEDGLHCQLCGLEPPWGCPCDGCQTKGDEDLDDEGDYEYP